MAFEDNSLANILYLIGFALSFRYLTSFDDLKGKLLNPISIFSLYIAWWFVAPMNMFIRNVIHKNERIQNWVRKLYGN